MRLNICTPRAQQLGAAGGDAAGQGGGGEVAIAQHQHPGVEAGGQPVGQGGLAVAGGAVDRRDQAAGAAGDQGDQAQQRIARAAVVAGLGGEGAMVGGGVGDTQGGAVDGAHQQPTDPDPTEGRHRGRASEQLEQRSQRRRPETAAGLGEGRGGGGGQREAVKAGAQPLPDLPIAQLGEQAPGHQQIHHHPGGQGTQARLGPAGGGQGRIDQLEGHLLGELAQVPRGKPTRRHRDGAVDDRLFHSGAPVGVVLEDTPLYRSSAVCSPTGQPRLDRPDQTLTTRHWD